MRRGTSPRIRPSRGPSDGAAGRSALVLLGLAALGLGPMAACEPRGIEFEGLAGTLIPLAAYDGREVPRLAFTNGGCPGPVGGCSSFCTDDPATCLAADPDACMPAVIATEAPLTVLPAPGGNIRTGRECFEVRAAAGLGLDPAGPDDGAVARFRFLDPPVLRAPAEAPEGWSWEVGDDRFPNMGVGAVIGGNLLNDFAVELRHDPFDPDVDPSERPTPLVGFSRAFPGSQRALADQGRAYLRLQYPNRLTGVQVRDQCQFGDDDCRLPELDVTEGRFRILHERFRMTLDACVAAAPCAVSFSEPEAGLPRAQGCRLSRGPGSSLSCAAGDRTGLGGRGASLVVSTSVPGLALVEDSATTIFGALDALPSCADVEASIGGPVGGVLATEVTACLESEADGALAVPGWPPLDGLPVLRLRSLALVSGSRSASSPGPGDGSQAPCDRALARLQGLLRQCEVYAESGEPRSPAAEDLEQPGADARIDLSVFQAGEVTWRGDQAAPDPQRWVRTLVLPADAPLVLFTRRDTGGESAQADGFVGGALLQNTEVVLDYSEADASPGVRVTCLEPGQGRCASIPVCAGGGKDERSRSCCFGLPQSLLGQTIQSGADRPPPRVEEQCCRALAPRALATLQAEGDVCAGVDPV